MAEVLPIIDLSGIDAQQLIGLTVGNPDAPRGLDPEIEAARTQAMDDWDALRSPLEGPAPLASDHEPEALRPNPVTFRSDRF